MTSDVCVCVHAGKRYSCASERCSSNVSYDARAFIWSESKGLSLCFDLVVRRVCYLD